MPQTHQSLPLGRATDRRRRGRAYLGLCKICGSGTALKVTARTERYLYVYCGSCGRVWPIPKPV